MLRKFMLQREINALNEQAMDIIGANPDIDAAEVVRRVAERNGLVKVWGLPITGNLYADPDGRHVYGWNSGVFEGR